MNRLGLQVAGIFLILAALIGGGFVTGYQWRDDEVQHLQGQVTALASSKADETSRADANAGTAVSLRASLQREAAAKLAQQKAAIAELDARADRISMLERRAARRQEALNNKVTSDEDCNALRTTAVCAALARGLWGDEASTGPH
ncbi:MAG: hypothetical protein ACREPD_04695 [Stenotrophomonas sp.]|uniref:hypothetical protein n=1 Tax=Stenotrophomonas sp. TaxID=69392 RepID=UPI003D6CFA3F